MEDENNIKNLTFNDQLLVFQESRDTIDNLAAFFTCLVCIALLVIVANSIVVVSSGLLFKKGYKPRSTYLLLGNISLADLLTGIILILAWPKVADTPSCCRILSGLYVMSAIVSSLSVGFIAIDRYFFIVHAIKYKQLMTYRRVRYVVIFSWIYAILCGLIPLQFLARDAPSCMFVLIAPPSILFSTSATGIFPVMCVLTLYPIILHKAIQTLHRKTGFKSSLQGLRRYVGRPANVSTISQSIHSVEVTKTSNSMIEKTKIELKTVFRYNPNKWKAIKIVMLTTITYTITWVPYFISTIIYGFCDTENTPKQCNDFLLHIATPFAMLTFTSTLTNPAIYAWFHNGFRRGIRNLFDKYKRMYQTKKQVKNINNKTDLQRIEVTHL